MGLKAIADEATKFAEALKDNDAAYDKADTLLEALQKDLETIGEHKDAIKQIVAKVAVRRLCQIEVPGPEPSPNVLSYGILLLGSLMLTWLFYAIRKRYRYVQPKLHDLQQVVVHMPSGLVQLLYKKHHE